MDGYLVEFETVPVPYNNIVLDSTVSGFIVTDTDWKNTSIRILLCNISSSITTIDMSCSIDQAVAATVIISAPAQYPNDPGRNYYWIQHPPLMAPVLELKMHDYLQILSWYEQANKTLNATIIPIGTNPWITLFNSGGFIFFQVVMALFPMINIVISIYNFVNSDLDKFPQVVHICLIVEAIGNMFRFVWFAVDPLVSKFIFPPAFSNVLQGISVPICMINSMLVGLFWHQLLQNKKLPSAILASNLKVVFFITTLVVVLLEVVEIIAYCEFPRSSTTLVKLESGITSLFLLVGIVVFSFYIYTGWRIVNYLKKDEHVTVNVNRKQRIRRIMYLIVPSMVIIFFMIFTSVFWAVPSIANTQTGFLILWILLVGEFNALSLVQILAFLPRETKNISHSSTTSKQGSSSSRTSEQPSGCE